MKKIILAFVFGMLALNTAQAKNMKLGVVSVEAILKNAPQVVAINKKMQERFTAPQQKLQKLGESIKSSQEQFKKDELILSKQQKTDTQKKIMASIQEYRESEMKLKNEVDDVRNQALAEFRFTVQKVLNKLAEDDAYDFIFSEGVAFAKPEYDLTAEVLKRLKKLSESDK